MSTTVEYISSVEQTHLKDLWTKGSTNQVNDFIQTVIDSGQVDVATKELVSLCKRGLPTRCLETDLWSYTRIVGDTPFVKGQLYKYDYDETMSHLIRHGLLPSLSARIGEKFWVVFQKGEETRNTVGGAHFNNKLRLRFYPHGLSRRLLVMRQNALAQHGFTITQRSEDDSKYPDPDNLAYPGSV